MKKYKKTQKKYPKTKVRQHKGRRKPKNKGVKLQLFLECGTIDMYDMQSYAKEKLTLHHYPPFRETRHTIFEESYLLTRENHDYIEYLDSHNPEKYKEVMHQIQENKKVLMKRMR